MGVAAAGQAEAEVLGDLPQLGGEAARLRIPEEGGRVGGVRVVELHPVEAEANRFTSGLREVAETLGLRLTRGSDAHFAADFDRVYGSAAGTGRE